MAAKVKETSFAEVAQAEYEHLAQKWNETYPHVVESLVQARIKNVKVEPPNVAYTPHELAVTVTLGEKYKVTLDVKDFSCLDVSIKILEGKISVEASREVKSKYGYEYRDIQKIFHIPDSVDQNKITAEFTDDALLIIEGPLKAVVRYTDRWRSEN